MVKMVNTDTCIHILKSIRVKIIYQNLATTLYVNAFKIHTKLQKYFQRHHKSNHFLARRSSGKKELE